MPHFLFYILGFTAKAVYNVSEKSTNPTVKISMPPYYSLPFDIFDDVPRGLDKLVLNEFRIVTFLIMQNNRMVPIRMLKAVVNYHQINSF